MGASGEQKTMGTGAYALFGQILQQLRQEAGLSQEALAFASGYHRTYISLLERGLNIPTLRAVFLLASALQVSASEMIRRVEALDAAGALPARPAGETHE